MKALLRRAPLRRLVGTLGATALVSVGTSLAFASVAHAAPTASVTYTFNGFGTVVVNGTVTDTNVLFSTYTVDPGVPCDGKTFHGTSCQPQTIAGVTQPIPAGTYDHQSFTTGASASCGYGQADIYTGTELTKIGSAGNNANGDHFVTGEMYTLGGVCSSTPPPSTPIAPTATSASCVSGAAVPGSITLPAGNYAVTDSTGTTVTALGSLAAGTYTVTATAPAGQTFLAPGATDTYVLSAGNTVATWHLTITGAGACTTSFVTPPPGAAPTGSIVESCPAESTGVQSYTVTLNNALNTAGGASTTPVQFQVRVDNSIVDTNVTNAGATYTYNGTLPVGSVSAVTAAYSTDSGTTWTPINLGTSAVTFPCVLGIQFTQSPPTAITPPTGVQPVAVVKTTPGATLPFTGLPTAAMLALSGGLILGGAVLLGATHRRKNSFI